MTPDGAVHLLDVGVGSLQRLADDRDEFVRKIDEGNNANEWLAIPLVDRCVQAGMILDAGQCYGFTLPPVLGGTYELDNMEIADFAVHFGLLGQIHEQIRGVPDGTPVQISIAH